MRYKEFLTKLLESIERDTNLGAAATINIKDKKTGKSIFTDEQRELYNIEGSLYDAKATLEEQLGVRFESK